MIIEENMIENTVEADSAEIQSRFDKYIKSGELQRTIQKLAQLQKHALTTNGPHPHHPNSYINENSSQAKYKPSMHERIVRQTSY